MQPDMETIEAARSTARWGTPHEHASLAAFLAATELPDGMHTIRGEIVPIDLLVRIHPGRPLVLHFHDNTPRNGSVKLPIFTGLNLMGNLDASYVALSDPSLHLDPELKLSWFAGADGLELQKLYPALLDKLIVLAGASDVICAGGSGGGFAALYYSASIEGSFAVTWNPHTDILRYNPAHVAEYGSAAFGLESHEATAAQLGSLIDTNLATVYGRPRSNLVLYLQNNSDGYVLSQMQPFLAALGVDVGPLRKGARINGVVADGLWLLLEDWGEGHVAPPPPALSALLAAIVSDPARWRAGWTKRENAVAPSRQSAA